MSLKDVLQKLRVSDLQNEIRKVLADFKGFKNMTKSQLIEVMLENESLFKHLEKLDTTQFKKENVPKPKGKIQKQRAEDKPEKEKLKKEPSEYIKFVKQYRMKNNLSLKDAMKEIKEKGLYKAKTPAKPKKKLKKEEQIERMDKLLRSRIRKQLVEYEKTVTDDPKIRDKTQFLKLKKIIGKKTPVQKKKRRMIREKNIKLYERLKELNFFEDIDIDKEESKQIKKEQKKEPKEEPKKEPKKEVKEKKKKPKKELSLDEMKKKEKQLDILIEDLQDTIKSYPIEGKRTKEQDKQRTKLVNQRADLQEERIALKKKIVREESKLEDEKQKGKDKEEQEEEEKKLLQFKINVEKFIKKPTDELNDYILDEIELIDELPKKDQDRLNKALDRFEGEEGEEEPTPAPKSKKELSTIEQKEIFEKENSNLGTFQKYDNKRYEKANFSFKKPVNNDKLINMMEKNSMNIIRSEIIRHFERIIYQCSKNVSNLKTALKLKNKTIKWKDLSITHSGSLKNFLNEVENQKSICLTEKQLNKVLKLNILSINDINRYKSTLEEEKDLMEQLKLKKPKKLKKEEPKKEEPKKKPAPKKGITQGEYTDGLKRKYIKNPSRRNLELVSKNNFAPSKDKKLEEEFIKAVKQNTNYDSFNIKKKQVNKKTEEPKKKELTTGEERTEAEKYRKKILETNKKIKLFNNANLKKKLDINDYGVGLTISGIDTRIDTMIKDKIELFSKTDILDIDKFKKGAKLKNRMFNIIDNLEKMIFRNKKTKQAYDFIDFLTNETTKREKLYIAVKIQASFNQYCNKLEKIEDFLKIIKPNRYKTFLERVKFLDERCLELIDIIDDLQDKFNITDKQIKDNELMIF